MQAVRPGESAVLPPAPPASASTTGFGSRHSHRFSNQLLSDSQRANIRCSSESVGLYAVDNLASVKVNAEASRSRIPDTGLCCRDLRVGFRNAQIIQQAGTAMLAQNQSPPDSALPFQ